MDTTARTRAAFVGQGLVTDHQWAQAVAEVGPEASCDAVLAVLARQPAAWAGDSDSPAVTDYHIKLVAHMLRAGSLDELPGRLRWNHFLILSELGRGGMGVVFRAWDTESNRLVAVKRIRGASRSARTRFRREGRVLARLDHPGIAKFLGVETVGGSEALVMEFVPGDTVSRLVRRLAKAGRVMPWETAVAWTTQVLDALAHAHARQVVHRDIKPGNLIVHKGRVTVLDMGLARCGDDSTGEAQLTRHGEAIGTREYMPPEQWEGTERITPAADLYALGCTLYLLLTGRPPYEGDTSYRQMTQHMSAAIPSVCAIRPDVPPGLDAVVQRMMSKNPAHRGTARELTWQLNRILVGVQTPAAVGHAVGDMVISEPASRTSESSPSVRTGPEWSRWPTTRGERASQTLLSGAGVRPLVRELATEVRRAVLRCVGRSEVGSVLGSTPGRLREVASELATVLADGLRGRRPDARGAAWAAVGAAAVAAVWFVSLLR